MAQVLFESRRAWRVRIAQAAVWLATAICIWLVATDPGTAGPTDRAVAVGGAGLMALFVLGMELYVRLYVLRVVRDGDDLVVTTLGTVWRRTERIAATRTSFGEERRDHAPPFIAPGYDNAWRTLKVEGRVLPLILDVT